MHPPLELIDAACNGDTEAIEQVLLQVQPSMLRFARRYCATPEDVEDAVQETLWIVHQKIGALRATAAFISWMFTIIRNACYRLLKREYHLADNHSSHLFPAFWEDGCELRYDLATAIARLPAAQRQVLIMRDVEGLTAPEVAAALGLTVSTVKSRLHRARSQLRELLDEQP